MNEKKIAEKHIEESQAALDKAKAELAKLDKPTLKDGDYCIAPTSCGSHTYVALEHRKNPKHFEIWGIEDGKPYVNGQVPKDTIYYVPTGQSIFDDLNAEDLEEFSVLGAGARLDSDGMITFFGTQLSCLDSQEEYHQKLGRLLRTLQKRRAKDGKENATD